MLNNGYGMGWGWLFGLLMLIGVALVAVVAVRAMTGGISRGASSEDHSSGAAAGPNSGRSRARQVLDERYARGELSNEEYRERRQTLGEDT